MIISFSACNKLKKDYYDDGSLKSEYTVLNDKFEGTYKEYYKSTGELKYTAYYKNGLLDGEKKSFYKDGKLKSIENYTENQLNGDCKYFGETGRIDSIKNYIFVNPEVYKTTNEEKYFKLVLNVFDSSLIGKKSQLNSVLRIRNDGSVDLKHSHYFEIALKRDTVNINDSINAVLFFRYRRDGRKTKYVVVQFANQNMDTFNVFQTDYELVFMSEKPSKKGVNYLRGYIEEYTPYGYDTLKNVLFFKKRYFVK